MTHVKSRLLLVVTLIVAIMSASQGGGMASIASATEGSDQQAPPSQHCGTPGGPDTCLVHLPLVMWHTPPSVILPFGINCGGWDVTLSDHRSFQRDQPYWGTNNAGYLAGEAVASNAGWEPIDGTDIDPLYHTARSGMTAYRVNVPSGHYVVELHVAEISHHGPYLRVFDVTIEGQPVISQLDLYELAQHDYAVRYRWAAEVQDGVLDITFSASTGQPLVSAIWIDRRAPDDEPPPAPDGLQVVGGYHLAIGRWYHVDQDDVAGYRVYRAHSQAGPFQVLTTAPTPLARFFDDSTVAGQSYCYRVAAVDIFGNEGPQSPAACAAVVDHDVSALPVLDLALSPGDLYALNTNPFNEVEVPGSLAVNGQLRSAILEYRGRSTRGSNKKSWKVVTDQPVAPWNQYILILNAEGYDPAIMREKMAYDLFDAAGIRPMQTRFVHLNLNDEFIGVFTQVENPDAQFLRRTGRDPNGDVFKCEDGLDTRPACTNQVVEGRNMAELYLFAAIVNRTPDDEFAAAIADVLDVRGFLDYQSIKSVTGDPDATYQYLLYHHTEHGRWEVLPWDNNVAFQTSDLPIDYGTVANPGWGNQVNMLLTRVLRVPQYRRYYGEQLLALTQGLFSSAAMRARFDAAKAEIWHDAQRDVWKAFREQNEHVATHISYLQAFVNQRIAFLESAVPAYLPAEDRFIALNELMTRNDGVVLDPADGQAEPWFEIFNAGLTPIDIGGMFLTDSMAVPNRYRIPPATVLPALGSLLFWADAEPGQGATHVNFTLSATGGQIHLVDRNGSTSVDAVDYPSLLPGVSLGRFPDQSGSWLQFRQPTPGQPNRLLPPTISNLVQTPPYPRASETVTITADISDDDAVRYASVIYGVGEPITSVPMFDDGAHGDGSANDGRYGAQIPGMANGASVKYYLSAADDYGRTATDPAAAPLLTHRYRVGFQPPPIIISEFMAANTSTIQDPDEPDEYPDWIELTNTGTNPININGYYLSDDLQRPWKHRIASPVTIPPGGAIVFWADDDSEQGPLHTNFKLNKAGEAVGFFDRDGATPIDTVIFPAQGDDLSYGRCLANHQGWEWLYLPTPGQPNACGRQYLPTMRHQ